MCVLYTYRVRDGQNLTEKNRKIFNFFNQNKDLRNTLKIS